MTIRVLAPALLVMILNACSTSTLQSTPAGTAVSGTSQSSRDASDASVDLDKQAREMGYHVERRNGEKAYCRNSAPTASHISRQDCLNTAGMMQVVRNAEKSQDELSRQQEQSYSGGARSPN